MAIRAANVTVQILFSPTVHLRSVNQTINWVEEPFRRTIRVANYTFQALMPGEPQIKGNATDDLGLQQLVTFFNVVGDRQVPTNELEFVQVANSPSFPQVFQEIIWTQNARSSLHNRSEVHQLGLWDQAQSCFGAPWGGVSVIQLLTLTDNASRALPHTASNTITWTQLAATIPGATSQFLDLVQTVSGGIGYELFDEIELIQLIESESDFLRSVAHTNVVEHAFTYYIDNKCNQKSYAKFDGEGSGDGLEDKRLTWDANFVLETIGSGTKTLLELKSPESDDGDRLGFERINRETRGGELNVFGDPDWSKVNTLLFTIVGLSKGQGNCPDKITALLNFLQDTLGEEIQLHDWTGVTWQGVVTTPNETATEDREGFWTITFEFEGIALPGSAHDQALILSHNTTRIMDFARPATDTIQFVQNAHAGGDIRADVSQTISFSEQMGGTQEIIMLDDDLSSGGGGELDGTSPGTGTETWRAHSNFKDDGSQSAGIDAGAYYPITLASGTIYECTWASFTEATASDSRNIIAGFYEDISVSKTVSGNTADGSNNPTTLKAGHLRRQVSGTPQNGYRLGSESDGVADSHDWTDATLRTTTDNPLDLRIIIDTTGGEGNWKATWQAKSTISSTYTEVGPESDLLSENIGAVGWSNDSVNTDMSCDRITLLELRSI